MAPQTGNMVGSERFKHSETCDLFNPRHSIPSEIADIVAELDGMDGFSAVSGGCNSCTAHLLDEGVYYVAQNSSDGGVYFGFGGDADAEAVAYQLIGCAVEEGVDYEWSGDTSKKVLINPQ